MLTKSPNEYVSEAELKITNLSIDPEIRYSQALNLFQSAASSFKASHNYIRAAETYRRCADCYFHLNNIQEAAKYLAESARLYLKGEEFSEIALKTLETAVRTYKECGNIDEAIKLYADFSTSYQKSDKIAQCIECLLKAADIASESGRDFEYCKYMRQAGELYIKTKNWKDAAKHFEVFTFKRSDNSTIEESHELAMIYVICSLYTGSVAAARGALDKLSKNISSWADSSDFKLTKEFVDSGMTKIESRIKKSADPIIENKRKSKLLVDLVTIGTEVIKPRGTSQ